MELVHALISIRYLVFCTHTHTHTHTNIRHVSQSDRPSKRYRNVHADVFVIADEDEENGMRYEVGFTVFRLTITLPTPHLSTTTCTHRDPECL